MHQQRDLCKELGQHDWYSRGDLKQDADGETVKEYSQVCFRCGKKVVEFVDRYPFRGYI